jgi:cysteine-rich repeat protein
LTGNLSTWLGKSPAGTWKLQVIDYAIGAGATDGEIVAFAVQVETLSTKKFAATGGFQLPVLQAPGPCNASNKGLSQLDVALGLLVCDGAEWQLLRFEPLCGNGLLNSGEQCDDGNSVATDGCFQCKTAFCGDGLVQPGEQCDSGVNNSDSKPDACRTTCKNPVCGDKVVDSTESCDDGNAIDGDGCSNACKLPCVGGWVYDGICLKAANLTSNGDAVPAGCDPYQPAKTWQKADLLNICNQFKVAGTDCNSPDTDADGGLCNNFQAIASWENNATPDMWLHKNTFNFTWVSGSQACNLKSDAASVVVYACK